MSNDIKRNARNASKDDHIFHNYLSQSLCINPFCYPQIDFYVNRPFQHSTSSPDGPVPPYVVSISFLTVSASTETNLIRYTSFGLSGNSLDQYCIEVDFFVLNVLLD